MLRCLYVVLDVLEDEEHRSVRVAREVRLHFGYHLYGIKLLLLILSYSQGFAELLQNFRLGV